MNIDYGIYAAEAVTRLLADVFPRKDPLATLRSQPRRRFGLGHPVGGDLRLSPA